MMSLQLSRVPCTILINGVGKEGFNSGEWRFHVNVLDLKGAIFGLKYFYKTKDRNHIFFHVEYTSDVAEVYKRVVWSR